MESAKFIATKMENQLYKNQIDFANIPDNAIVLDVRNASEHSEIALKRGHYFIELPRFDAKNFIKECRLKGEPVCVLCRSGMRASKAAVQLENAGYSNVYILKDGIAALSGKPDIVYENKVMSMERQVRIVAGTLVLLGSVLALVSNSAFALLPAFVGCGLIYAGISNTCAMASLLAKLPWNK